MMSYLRQRLVQQFVVALLLGLVKVSPADILNEGSCMTRWLILAGFTNASVVMYERSMRGFYVDEATYNQTFQRAMISLVIHPKDQEKFFQCMGRQTWQCWRSSPCGVGSECLLNAEKNYYCKCKVGWTGDFCTKKEVDGCDSNPCQNGANCTNSLGRYQCACQPGFEGQRCEKVCWSHDVFKGLPKLVSNLARSVKSLYASLTAAARNVSRLVFFSAVLDRKMKTVEQLEMEATDWTSSSGSTPTQTHLPQHCNQSGGFFYREVCLKISTVITSAGHGDIIPGGCSPYQPSVGWGFNDYNVICKHFGRSSNCGNVDTDVEGGRCSNHQAVLSYEANGNPDVWVNSRTFGPGWKPTRTSSPDCRLVTHSSLMVIVYACEL